ncbi:SpaA isopeptide-forming pilin-related protein [Kitasatospora sp. NPDC093806]|uniref:MSCRAMM family protein n=1 Tax=Kitasatospora sp. NPDC093806 TaxID=3155075 RepID=UPI003425D8C8
MAERHRSEAREPGRRGRLVAVVAALAVCGGTLVASAGTASAEPGGDGVATAVGAVGRADGTGGTGTRDPGRRQTEGAVSVTATDPDGRPLAGAVLRLWRESNGTPGLQPETDTGIGDLCTTAADGVCARTVPFGSYYWQETAAPDGYLPADPAVLGPLTLDQTNEQTGVTVRAVHRPLTGRVTVIANNESGLPLAGTDFRLWRETNGVPGLQQDSDTPASDVCTTVKYGVCDRTVPLGSYYWEETKAPEGYLPPDPPVLALTLDRTNQPTGVTVTAVNRLGTGRVSVTKTDPDGRPLAGAVFQLWHDDNGTPGLQTDTDSIHGALCTTAADGVCARTVPFGSYYWQETAAPAGYLLPTQPVAGPLRLGLDNYRAGVGVSVVDHPVTGAVRVRKRDARSRAALAGAVFRLWRESNGVDGLQSDTDTGVGDPCTTGADGECVFGSLLAGRYYVQESAAPAGYRIPARAVHEVTLDGREGAEHAVLLTVDDERLPSGPPLPETGGRMPPAAGAVTALGLVLAGGALVAVARARARTRRTARRGA